LPALYRQALFFAYPSHYEGFGLPLVEAMTLGVPILTADNSSLMEVAGDSALYVDSHRGEAIASGLKTLIADASLRERLGHEGRERAKLFEWPSFVETLIALATKTS
jgi:glycosyltransferase involved in cell wall biosynthesis